MEIQQMRSFKQLPLLSLNHVSLLVRSVPASMEFYEQVLGFILIKRPSSFNFHGAWLFNYGVGIHLLENEYLEFPMQESRAINPKDNHISFQCTDVELVKRRLTEMGLEYVAAVVEEGGAVVDQVFFHDPDGYMIEICNCDNIPVIPLSAGCASEINHGKVLGTMTCGMMEAVMMESLSMDMLNFSF